jgi:acyl-coenzyme A synthetase/AMP-(fatty) acid ligase
VNNIRPLWQSAAGTLHDRADTVLLNEFESSSTLGGKLESLRGRNVLLASRGQLTTALALIELHGVARRLVLCTPELTSEQLASIAASAQANAVIVDSGTPPLSIPAATFIEGTPRPVKESVRRRATEITEWVLLTSGTTGMPKLVLHSLETLGGALPRQSGSAGPVVWSTFYDIRRYGGLQIYLRAVLSGVPLVLSSAGESIHDFLTRAAAAGVTHISGTPSHWRRALMSGEAALISPAYVRLSGEVADQTVLDNLRSVYPKARIAHAFASTEAGVAFDVNDGLAGFPAALIDKPLGSIEMKVQDGTLWIRSGRTAARYLGKNQASLASEDCYVDTGDMVERDKDRYYFRGRKGGIINVGGLKVYPEEVESVLNADPRVRMSRVMARRNPLTGSLVVAEVVLTDADKLADPVIAASLKSDLVNACRNKLAAHKVPALLRFVPTLEFTAAGKLVRPNA